VCCRSYNRRSRRKFDVSDDSAVASTVAARILEIRVRKGDSAKACDVIAMLDDPQLHAREQQVRAQAEAAEAQRAPRQQQIAVQNDQLKQTELPSQATVDADGRVRQAEAEHSSTEAQFAKQEASLELALYDRDAYTRLAKAGACIIVFSSTLGTERWGTHE